MPGGAIGLPRRWARSGFAAYRTVVTVVARFVGSLSDTTVVVMRAEAADPAAGFAKTGTRADWPAVTATSAFRTPPCQPAPSTLTLTR